MTATAQPVTPYEIATGACPPPDAGRDVKGRYSFERYACQNDHYIGYYQNWTKTVLFLEGRQHLTWLNDQRRFSTDTGVPPWRQQPVTNITYAVYRTLVAKLTKQKPTLEVVPPSGDGEDRESAEVAEALLVHLWRLLKTPQKIKRALGWYLCTGQVYLDIGWDTEAGKRVPLTQKVAMPLPTPDDPSATVDVECPCDEDGQLKTTGDGQPDLDAEPALVPMGEILFGVEDPMSVRYNPEAIDEDDADEMFVGKLWSKTRAAAHFEMDASEFDADGDSDRDMYADLMSSAATGPGWLGVQSLLGIGVGAPQDVGDRVLVVRYYRKPDDERPDGAHWISIGRKQVWPKADDAEYPTGEAPLPFGFWPPLIPVLDLPLPGQPQAMGVLGQVVPLNEKYNTVDGRIMEHEVTMTMGGAWVVHPEDAGLEITSEPAQILVSKGYAHGAPPVQVPVVALPAAVYEERNIVLDSVRMIGSLSEAELGSKPEGVSAGRAFLVLQEVTDSALGPALQAWEEALEEVGRRELVVAQQKYREDRIIQIRGERGKWEVQNFTGADLADGLDVRVQVGSSAPWSKTAQQDLKLQVLTALPGLVTDMTTGKVDEEKLAHYLAVGSAGLDMFDADEDPDLAEIEREHDMFAQYDPAKGQLELPQLAVWQSQPKHLEGHFDFMKRDFGRFKKWVPAAQAAFLTHIQATVAAVDELAAMATAAATPGPDGAPMGGPPSAGGPGGYAEEAPVPGAMDGTAPPALATGQNPNESPMLSHADMAAADPSMTTA